MPRLAAFPKAFMQALCKDGTMTVSEWIRLAADLEIEGLEWYAGFLEMEDPSNWSRFRKEVRASLLGRLAVPLHLLEHDQNSRLAAP